MDWMVPSRRLDEAQQAALRQCAEMTDKPKWIEGFAGSGKTVFWYMPYRTMSKGTRKAGFALWCSLMP